MTDKANAALHKQKQAEQDAAYARSHMKIKEVEVERKVLYEKCKNCKQSLLDKKITNYRKRKEYIEKTSIMKKHMEEYLTDSMVPYYEKVKRWKQELEETLEDAKNRIK